MAAKDEPQRVAINGLWWSTVSQWVVASALTALVVALVTQVVRIERRFAKGDCTQIDCMAIEKRLSILEQRELPPRWLVERLSSIDERVDDLEGIHARE